MKRSEIRDLIPRGFNARIIVRSIPGFRCASSGLRFCRRNDERVIARHGSAMLGRHSSSPAEAGLLE
jgi:hypothetical protein